MPLYLYENKKTGEVVEVLQSMNEVHEYHGEDGTEKGAWRRVFVNPSLSTATKLDPNSPESFRKSTVGKNDTYDDLFKRSEEASNMRADKNSGVDPVKEKYYKKYREKTNGKTHPKEQKEKFQAAQKRAKAKGVNIEL